ncbi:Ig-like domain-containing protein, partial [Gammaproteobacteria bacterium]|nr:Ig-like domain-containing protein [Gammaproteobacteria bacterium]
MGDIPTKVLGQFELNTTERLKASLLEDLKNNKKSKQVIKLNGKSSLVFANLAALTLASCGGGGGGSSSTPVVATLSFSNQSFTFDEDTPGTFSISSPTNASGALTITVDSIPTGLTLTTSDGVLLAAGTELTASQLSNISYTSDENANSDLNNFGNLVLSASDGSATSTSNISFTVTAVNDAPSLVANSFSFTEDTAAAFSVSVIEVDGDTLTITVDTLPTEGTLTLADGTLIAAGDTLTVENLEGIIFTPNADVNTDSNTIGDLVLSISDGTVTESNSISLIVSAVNDAPVLGTLAAVDVLETIVADATILTLAGTDVDGDTLTYTLAGDDADLFSVDSSGNVSFKVSPNFKSPGDVGLDNNYSLTMTVTDAAGITASSALSINILDVKPGGQAIDGYLVGATVWVDLDGDGIKDENEPETSTDKTGAFEFEDDIPAGTDIYVEGGYDLGTGKPNEQKFKLTTSITGDGTEALVISPVSTQISRAYAKTGVTLSEAQEKVGKAYGLDEVFDNLTNFDPIALAYSATSNEQAKAALTAQARNIMVSSLGEVSKKVSEYFASEIAPTTRSQLSDIFKFGTQTLRNGSWDSNVDLQEQPRIVIELEGFEDLLASTSETFNDKIVEAILASEDLTKLFEMKSDGTGQFDAVISNATDAIILEIRNLILSEMGFDPATNFTTFKSLENYTGETVTFLGSTKTMGEWAVIMTDILDSQSPDPYTGRVDFGPDGGVTDNVGKYFAQQMAKMARLMETTVGKPFSELTDAQIDQLVDMGFEYNRGNTFADSNSRWVPFDEYGQELWSQNVYLNYNQERFQYDSQGNRIEGNTGQWQLTAEQVKAYLKDPSIQLKDGNWGNEFTTYNWTVTSGDLGMYLALAEARDDAEMKTLMDALTTTEGSAANFVAILDASFTQGKKVFQNLVSSALDFTLDKFTKFVEKTIDYENDEAYIALNPILMPVTKSETVTLSNGETLTLNTLSGRDWDINSYGNMSLRVSEEGDYTYTLSGKDADLFTINDLGVISFKDAAPDVSGLTDANNDYALTVTVTDTSDGFTQEVEFKVTVPVWESLANSVPSIDVVPTLENKVIEVNEHTLIRDWNQYNDPSPDTTIIVTVVNDGNGNKYYFDGVLAPNYTFIEGARYTFDVSDPSNAGHPLKFSLTKDGTHAGGEMFGENINYTGTSGEEGAQTEVFWYGNGNPETLYYYCEIHSGMANDSVLSNQEEPEPTFTQLYLGIPLDLNLGSIDGQEVWVNIVETDRFGSEYQDNHLFYVRTEGEGADRKFYLNLRGSESLDFENPLDGNGDNIYNLTLQVQVRAEGSKQPVSSLVDMVLVVNNIDDDPVPSFPSWWNDDNEAHWSYRENETPVATVSEVEINGKTLNNTFIVGQYSSVNHDTEIPGNITTEELLAVKFPGPITSSITGGADADKFIVVDRDNGSAFFFKARPSFDNPSDADGDNIYEFELTKSDGANSITKTVRIQIMEPEEGSSAPLSAPSSALVLNVDEVAENIGGDRGGSRNILGTEGSDEFVKDNYGFKYIDGGAGDDVFKELREGYLTGGEGADKFFISADSRVNKDNFGIRDDSDGYVEGSKEGINGYDQNRDGVLDLATELNYTRVPVISDFTPGVDKIHLTTYGWTGQNVPTIQKSKVTIEQGTGDLANHTLIVLNDNNAIEQGHANGSVIAVLLDTDATTVSKDTDLIEDGSDNQLVLGNLRDAVGGTTVILQDTAGNDVPVIQLENGEYIWIYLNGNDLDNQQFYRNFATSPNGDLYVPRSENLDFENPTDANKDNTYELLFVGQTFSTLVLEEQSYGGYQPKYSESESTGNIAFNVFINVQDVVSDNVGKISIAEADFFGGTADGNTGDAVLNEEMIDLIFKQISAVQGSLMDIDFQAIAEEINFDFNFFATADTEEQAQEWFADYQSNSFNNFGRELEETFERNLLSKFSTYTNANSLVNITGTAEDDSLTGTDAKETIFGKKGDDTILGGAGDDVIFGDQGDDILDGGAGADAMDGGAGADTFIVGEGLDVMDGASGNDVFDFSNVTSLPEYIKGGSGTDTLVLAGLSSNGLEVDDGADADALPDYTGIDLNKLVSVKETWTYTDDAGNQVQEEGWRNRLESIEAIDLRDSESQINKSYNENKVDTLGFRLANNKVTIEDSDGSIHSLYTSAGSSTLSADLIGGSLLQSNLANIVSSDSSTGVSPILRFSLDSIPALGQTGTSSVTLKLYDGTDSVQATGERLLETTINLTWSSDGENVVVTLPAQSLTINYLSSDGNALTRTWENVESDALTFSYDDNGQPGLDLAVASFFSGQGAVEGFDLTGYITSGDYFFDVGFTNLEFLDENDNIFSNVSGGFNVAATPSLTAYIDDVITTEASETASVIVNLSKAASSDVTINYSTTDGTAIAGSDYTSTSGTLTIAAGSSSGTIVVPVTKDDTAEGPETFTFTLSDPSGAVLGRSVADVTINNETVFSDVLNITWDSLQRMSWDNRTWTIRGDDTDTVRLLGHEYTYNNGGSTATQFEPFRFKGTTVQDGITYNKYELWDGRVLIEAGVNVIYGRRELGKAIAGQNEAPEFWYQWKTVYENAVAVYGKVENEYDLDGDTLTYSLEASGDYALFNIDSTTGEVTFKVAPNYEAPASQMASAYGTQESDFSSVDGNLLRQLNQYQVTVIGNDGSGEANAAKPNKLYIDVRNLPDYDGYDPTNKIPFFKDMWGSGSKFIDDAANQSIQIKGFDLDFDTLTWTLVGVQNNDNRWGEVDGQTGLAIADGPLSLSSTGVLTPKSTISYEDGNTWYRVNVSITDGKSTAVTKEYYFQVEDTLDDGTLVVDGTLMSGSHSISGATVWQDLDNDGVQDVGETGVTTNIYGNFSVSLSKSTTDAPILAKGGILTGSGLGNKAILKINSNLKEVLDRDWGNYSLAPTSSISLSMQNLDRSISDKQSSLDIQKAFGFDPLWHEGDGNFYGARFYDIKNNINLNSTINDWEAFNLNIFTLNNLLTVLGNSYSKAAVQIVTDALADINTTVSGTSNVSGYSAGSLTSAQVDAIEAAAYQAMFDAVAETVSGKTAFDGFRLSDKSPITITDHEGSQDVVHSPSHSVADGVLTLNTANSEISKTDLQSALSLEAGSKGMVIQVELGTLPTTAQTIEFKGVLIDGLNSTVDSGERGIDVRFQVIVDPTKEVGASDYAYVPASSDITVIYTGEDGIATSTTVTHSGNMIQVTTNSQGVPVMSVDFTE